ncbi:MAG: YggS family pyridoxal phosphate-dependent enzyme [Clostridia bacterium]|nr:YggS family pyridoxal phosphate-dependent enzyme [Clostridia bacterium]
MIKTIKENLDIIREKINRAAEASGRRGEDIMLLAATKMVDADRINEAVSLGVKNIGENKVQELTDKYDKVTTDATWHFIGHLQTNKVKYIIDKAQLIHSVESERLLEEIDRCAAKKGICARVLIEINQSGEQSKFGIEPDEIWEILENNEKREHVKIEGLMTIGPNTTDEAEVTRVFRELNKLFLDIGQKKYNNSSMKYLSMGMSGDYELAIREGSNVVRIGSAIFGRRNY